MFLGKYGAMAGAVAVAACWPFATGQIAQSMYEREVAQFSSPDITVEQREYHRGYLDSRAVTRLHFKGDVKLALEEAGLPSEYDLASEITHGVLGVSSTNTLVLTPELQTLTQRLWPGNPTPIRLDMETLVTGASDYQLTVAPFSFTNEGKNLTASELTLMGSLARDGEITFDFNWPAAALNADNGEQIKIDTAKGQGRGYLQDDLWIGEQAFSVEGMRLVDTSNQAYRVGKSQIQISNQMVNADENTRARIDNANRITVSSFTLPDNSEWRNIALVFDAKGLDYQAMATIAGLSSDLENPEQVDALDQAMMTLLQQGLSLDIAPASITLPDGDVSANVALNLAKADPQAAAQLDLNALVSRLSGNIDITVPDALLSQPQWQAKKQQLIKAGYATMNEGQFELTATIEGNQIVSSNGESMPLMLFAMLMI
ncbi:DUF945 family protein [Salinivibrio proteolyticus]|uniref:DUF945 family protein n=1 Tax=Salinivibrio proteolyticus TaxID=334715 RepID=A0ABY7L8Z9_9GAMM|nr:DUF945 family protein [Salinivibrio proteolyticus]WBA13731.1 DUF945 family protein [Salinivibrio proteolyticus]